MLGLLMSGKKNDRGRGNSLYKGLEAGKSEENLRPLQSDHVGEHIQSKGEHGAREDHTTKSPAGCGFIPRGVKRPEIKGLLMQIWGDAQGDHCRVWLGRAGNKIHMWSPKGTEVMSPRPSTEGPSTSPPILWPGTSTSYKPNHRPPVWTRVWPGNGGNWKLI